MAVFYGLALLLSWSYWMAMLAMGMRVEPGSTATHLPGLMGPAVAASLVAIWRRGWRGLGRWWRDALWPRSADPSLPTNLLLAMTPVLMGALVFGAMAFFGPSLPGVQSFSEYPGVPSAWGLLPVFTTALVLNGIGEELGWRGFLTPALDARFGRFRATLVVAGLWLFWHLPLFWLHAGMAAMVGLTLLGWMFGLTCGAFVLSWVYWRSGQQVWVVALWHTLYNFMVATPAGEGVAAAVISTAVMVWGMGVARQWRRQSRSAAARTLY